VLLSRTNRWKAEKLLVLMMASPPVSSAMARKAPPCGAAHT
jgi:hypothetical protein